MTLTDREPDRVTRHPRRVLYRFDGAEPFAYARGNDWIRCRDHLTWAHQRDGQLISARSGEPLAYLDGSLFHDVVTRRPVYYGSVYQRSI